MHEIIQKMLEQVTFREEDGHKGTYGHVLVVAGSPGMSGAAYFTAMGALRSGSGLVSVALPQTLNSVMEVKLSEALTLPLSETEERTIALDAFDDIAIYSERCDALVVGPGLSLHPETEDLVLRVVQELELPLVLDADGLSAFYNRILSMKQHAGELIITPHPGEMSNLLDIPLEEVQSSRDDVAKEFAKIYNCVVVLKGHETVVASPDGFHYVNDTGNPGMGTGGMGDVLSGMIASLWGQGLTSFEAATLGVYLHGRAGDLAVRRRGQLSLLPTDLLEQFGKELWF